MATKLSVPEYIPDPPTPAITRPIIRAVILGAAPQTALPISNSTMLKRYRYLALKTPYAFPYGRTHVVARAKLTPI